MTTSDVSATDSASPRKALILSQDDTCRETASKALRSAGYKLILVGDGVEGVDAILSTRFDIVICDTQLPSLPGELLFKSVSRMRPHLSDRFIFVTGAGAGQLSEPTSAAAIGVLTKPLDPGDLLDLVAYTDLRLGER